MLQLAHFTRTIHSDNDDAAQKRSELREHIARLTAELEAVKQELASATAAVAPSSPPVVQETQQPQQPQQPQQQQKEGAPGGKRGSKKQQKKAAAAANTKKAKKAERVPYGRHPLEQTAKGRRKLHTLLTKRRELEDRLRYARLSFASLDPSVLSPNRRATATSSAQTPPQTPNVVEACQTRVAERKCAAKKDGGGEGGEGEEGAEVNDGCDALNFAPPRFSARAPMDIEVQGDGCGGGGGGGGAPPRGKLFAREKATTDTSSGIETCDPAICPDCDAEMIISHRESVYICMLCYGIRKYTCMNNIGQQSEEANARAHSEYHRVGHFANYMQMFQAKESKDVPKAIMDIVRASIKTMAPPEDGIFHIQTIRDILKQKRLSQFYANATQIWCKINKKPPPTLTPEQEAELYSMFNEIQPAYEKHNTERTNFVFYPYVFRKFCELQGYTHITGFVTHLKARKRLGSNEQLWKKICKDLNWEFIPTSWAATHM